MELITQYLQVVLIGILAAINFYAFFVMARDKRKAVKGSNLKRTSEGYVFFLAILFGSVGVYLGMLAFRHKTKKLYFQVGIPLLIAQNAATLYLLREIILT